MRYMLTSSEEKIANEWEKYKGYTVRPLPSTVAYYRQWLSPVKSALLYGGTPEIRSLFQSLQSNVVLMDRDPTIVRAMGKLTCDEKPISDQETFLQANWLNVSSVQRQFDLLMGDDAINMVQWHDFPLFLKNAARLLNENGLFVCHLLVKPDEALIQTNVEEILKQYQQGKIASIYDLASRLNFICYQHHDYSMGWQQTITTLGKEAFDLFKPDLDFMRTFGYCNSRFYCPPQAEFEALVTHYFHIEELFYPHEHDYCRYEPVYLLRKKENRQ